MPDPGTLRRGPLAATLAEAAGAAGLAVSVRALPPAARFSLRLPAPVLGRHPLVAGFRLDLPINRFATEGARTAVRLGPDEWLLIGPEGDGEAISREISAPLGGAHHSLVDIGHGNAALEVAGPAAAAVLSAGCSLDLDPARFPTGMGTRTLIGKADVVLMRTGDEPRYRLECQRSFARYLDQLIGEAAQECTGP
jgi:sarcosine oxidase subunit gamma